MKIDNVDMNKEFGVVVSRSSGDFDLLKRKDSYSYSYPDHHGQEVDTDSVYHGPREIKLSCHILASSKDEFIAKLAGFVNFLSVPGLHNLELPYTDRVHRVYVKDESHLTRYTYWSQSKQVGKFEIKFVEPDPASIQVLVYQLTLQQVSILMKIVTGDVITIDWGDGESTTATGDDSLDAHTHDYYKIGTYRACIYGDLSGLKEFICTNNFVSVNINDFRYCGSEFYYLNLAGSNTKGHLSFLKNLPAQISCLAFGGFAEIRGDISFIQYLKLTVTVINFQGSGIDHYTKTKLPAFSSADFHLNVISCGLSATEVDDLIIDLDEMGLSGGELNYTTGNSARTSASDAAYTSLTVTKSWTIT